jgi:hypothetical protein
LAKAAGESIRTAARKRGRNLREVTAGMGAVGVITTILSKRGYETLLPEQPLIGPLQPVEIIDVSELET